MCSSQLACFFLFIIIQFQCKIFTPGWRTPSRSSSPIPWRRWGWKRRGLRILRYSLGSRPSPWTSVTEINPFPVLGSGQGTRSYSKWVKAHQTQQTLGDLSQNKPSVMMGRAVTKDWRLTINQLQIVKTSNWKGKLFLQTTVVCSPPSTTAWPGPWWAVNTAPSWGRLVGFIWNLVALWCWGVVGSMLLGMVDVDDGYFFIL